MHSFMAISSLTNYGVNNFTAEKIAGQLQLLAA